MCIHQIRLRLMGCEFCMTVSTMYQHFAGRYWLCNEFRPENRCGRSFQNVGTCQLRYQASHPRRPHCYNSAELCLIAVCASHLLVLHCKYLFKIQLPYYSLLWFKTCYLSKYLLGKNVVYLFKWTYLLLCSFEMSICCCFKVQILCVQSTQFLVKLY
jgi:hypothetical protein